MTKATRQITRGIERAIQAEADGYVFYSMAARSTQDAKGREVFETLAREELEHRRFLQAQYHALSQTGKPDAGLTLGARTDLAGESPLFSQDIRRRIHEAHFEMSALSIAIQLELNSERYYRSQADKVSNRVIKKFFRELADWESGHYQALLRQQTVLKEDYWTKGGFAPF